MNESGEERWFMTETNDQTNQKAVEQSPLPINANWWKPVMKVSSQANQVHLIPVEKQTKEPLNVSAINPISEDVEPKDNIDADNVITPPIPDESVNLNREMYEKAAKKFNASFSEHVADKLDAYHVNMAHYGFNEEGLSSIMLPLMVNTRMTYLNLTGNRISTDVMKHVGAMLSENVTILDLDLSSTYIGGTSVQILCIALAANNNIKTLSVCDNQMSDEDGVTLANTIEEHKSLTKLCAKGNNFSDESGKAFGQMIAESTHLEYVDLSWNKFRGQAAVHVIKGLKDNGALQYLNLAWNGFDDSNAADICDAIRCNNSLLELDLSANRLGGNGFLIILKSFRENDRLKTLRFQDNFLTNEAVHKGIQLLEEMDELTLETLDVTGCHFGGDFEAKVAALTVKHPHTALLWGYRHTYGKRKQYNAASEAFDFLLNFVDENNINLVELFSKFDSDGSMSVSYDEFRQGIQEAKIPLSQNQVTQLIELLDSDGDGDIDFGEFLVGADNHAKQKKEEAL